MQFMYTTVLHHRLYYMLYVSLPPALGTGGATHLMHRRAVKTTPSPPRQPAPIPRHSARHIRGTRPSPCSHRARSAPAPLALAATQMWRSPSPAPSQACASTPSASAIRATPAATPWAPPLQSVTTAMVSPWWEPSPGCLPAPQLVSTSTRACHAMRRPTWVHTTIRTCFRTPGFPPPTPRPHPNPNLHRSAPGRSGCVHDCRH